jgi:mono/diheme cytochrome c family protein
VTEIPEHLLKRSRERRSQLTGTPAEGAEPAADAAGAEPASTVPATTAAAAPAVPNTGPGSRVAGAAPPAAPAPKPDSPVVAAAKRRTKIPFWAMAGLSLMPLWGFMYVRALTEPPEVAEDPLTIGAEVYAGVCSSCHLADGAGSGSGRQLNEGEVLATFPNIEDQIRFVSFGTQNYQNEGIDVYGDPDREGGVHETNSLGLMPAQSEAAGGGLTDVEILSVVCDERYTIGGADPESDEYAEEFEQWCSEESPIFVALEAEETTLAELADAGIVNAEGSPIEILPIGDAPAPASPASP